MKRDDLPPGNDGWQVLDPTPQEQSDGTVHTRTSTSLAACPACDFVWALQGSSAVARARWPPSRRGTWT